MKEKLVGIHKFKNMIAAGNMTILDPGRTVDRSFVHFNGIVHLGAPLTPRNDPLYGSKTLVLTKKIESITRL
jgi:hypothetical protein